MRLPKLRRRAGGVIDRRGEAPATGGVPGLGFPTGGRGLPIPGGRGGLGLGAIVLVLVLAFVLPRCLGSAGGLIPNPGAVEGFPDAGSGGSTTEVDLTDPVGAFVDAVGDDIQITWEELFAGAGDRTYEPTQIVLFRGSTQTGCGLGTAETGPFYCPADRRVYLDFSFFKELEQRFGASGDFAEAYVIAHEIGHHVQTLLGINAQVQRASRDDPSQANALSIRLELQADCLAGVWGSSANARGVLEPGDLEEGIGAAAAVGDDRIQASVTGRIDPETWTHGSSEQRVDWFQRGFRSGNPEACDTFSVSEGEL
jgi:predicted metalloprotease